MPTLSITKTYDDTQALTEAMLDNIKDGVETFVNTTKLDADNLQDGAVTTAKLASSAVTTAKINNSAVDENKLATSVAGSGLAGGAGTALSVNVDASTIEINADTLRVKDAGITAAKLAAAVAGDGLAGGAGTALSVNVDASTIEINADTLRVKDAGITAAKLAAAVAGNGLAGGAGTALSVNVDASTIEIDTDTLRVKDAGITAAKLAAAVAGNGLAGGAGTALSVNVDDSTIEISSDSLRVKDAGVTQAKLASRSVTTNGTNPGAGGVSMSASVSANLTSSTVVDITGLACTLTVTGRPVRVFLTTASTGTTAAVGGEMLWNTGTTCNLMLVRGSTVIGSFQQSSSATSNNSFSNVDMLDTGATAGTYTWKVQGIVGNASQFDITTMRLVVYEI